MPWKIWEPPWSNWSNLVLQPVSPLFFGVYILKSAAEDLNSNNLNIVSNYSLRGRLSNCFRLLLFSLECLNLWNKLLPSPDNWVKFLQDNFPLTMSLEPARIPTNFCLLRSLVALQLLSCVRLFATPWTAAGKASLSFTISQSLLKLMSIESVIPSNQLILCHPLLLLPSIFPSIKVFCKELALHIRWPECWSFNSASVLPMNIQYWFPLGLTGFISLQSKGLSRVFSSTTGGNHQFSMLVPSHCLDSQPVLAPAS